MSKCRACGQFKAKGDLCNNPQCGSERFKAYIRAKRPPIVATKSHGFHAPCVLQFTINIGGWS